MAHGGAFRRNNGLRYPHIVAWHLGRNYGIDDPLS
jgi:hypothetical protein